MTLHELRKRPHWSFSALNQLLNICSLQYFFAKVERLQPAHVPVSLAAGSVHHRTLDQVYLARKTGLPLTLKEALELYTQDWRRSSMEENIKYGQLKAGEVEAQGRALIEVAWEHIDPEEKILQVGETFCVPIPHRGGFLPKPLVGEFDLVVEKEGNPVVVDWKTAASRWPKDKADKSLQATAYAAAYRQQHGILPKVRFDVAVKNKTPVFEQHSTRRTPESWKLLGALAAKAEQVVQHDLFYPSLDSFACSDCPFANACKAWCSGKYARKEVRDDLAA